MKMLRGTGLVMWVLVVLGFVALAQAELRRATLRSLITPSGPPGSSPHATTAVEQCRRGVPRDVARACIDALERRIEGTRRQSRAWLLCGVISLGTAGLLWMYRSRRRRGRTGPISVP